MLEFGNMDKKNLDIQRKHEKKDLENFGICLTLWLRQLFTFYKGAGRQRELVRLLIICHFHFSHTWIVLTARLGSERRGWEVKMVSALNQQVTLSHPHHLCYVWLTPPGKTDISFLSTLSEDFADFFPDGRIENLVCLRIRAPTFLDRVMFGRLTGKWIGKMLSAQQCRNSTDPRNQQFGFAGKIFSSSAQIYLLPGGNHPNKPEL